MAAVVVPLAAQFGLLLLQEAPVLVADVVALFKKHPALTPDVLAAMAAPVHASIQAELSVIAADQAAHPTG